MLFAVHHTENMSIDRYLKNGKLCQALNVLSFMIKLRYFNYILANYVWESRNLLHKYQMYKIL